MQYVWTEAYNRPHSSIHVTWVPSKRECNLDGKLFTTSLVQYNAQIKTWRHYIGLLNQFPLVIQPPIHATSHVIPKGNLQTTYITKDSLYSKQHLYKQRCDVMLTSVECWLLHNINWTTVSCMIYCQPSKWFGGVRQNKQCMASAIIRIISWSHWQAVFSAVPH